MLIFKCPGCKFEERQLEEVSDGCIIGHKVNIADSGELFYSGEPEIYDSYIDRYQCIECGYTIKDSNEVNITDAEELTNWLKNRIKELNYVKR